MTSRKEGGTFLAALPAAGEKAERQPMQGHDFQE